MKAHLTERKVKALEPGPKNIIIVDDEVVGFGVRITSAGARSFVLSYNIHGRSRRITIGSWPDWSVNRLVAARRPAYRVQPANVRPVPLAASGSLSVNEA